MYLNKEVKVAKYLLLVFFFFGQSLQVHWYREKKLVFIGLMSVISVWYLLNQNSLFFVQSWSTPPFS